MNAPVPKESVQESVVASGDQTPDKSPMTFGKATRIIENEFNKRREKGQIPQHPGMNMMYPPPYPGQPYGAQNPCKFMQIKIIKDILLLMEIIILKIKNSIYFMQYFSITNMAYFIK